MSAQSPAIHLDTNVLIGALVPGSAADRALQRWVRAGGTFAISSIAWAEFLCGPIAQGLRAETQSAARRLVGDPVPFDGATAELAAGLFNATGRRRGSLGDCMVAASAMRHGASLATANVADFAAMRDVGLEVRAV